MVVHQATLLSSPEIGSSSFYYWFHGIFFYFAMKKFL
jgi:hypothetical protein